MSEDPKGFDAGDYNLFRYVGNEPLDRTDPMGLVGIDNWTSYTDVPPPPPPVTVAPAATAAAAQQTSSISMAYARGSGFTDSQWKKFDQAQQGAANRLANASARIDNALEHGGKELNAVTKAFEKVFGRDSATAENMSKRSGIMKGMMTALRDDGSKGYIANAMSESSRTLGRGVVGGKTIEINVAHRSFGDSSALTWAAGHESGHNMGLGHGTLNGVTAYKYGNEAERSAYKNLPPSERLGNPDNYMDFAR